jgi:hypothetical protein
MHMYDYKALHIEEGEKRPTVDLGMSEKVTKLEGSHLPARHTGHLVSRYRVS